MKSCSTIIQENEIKLIILIQHFQIGVQTKKSIAKLWNL